MSNEMPFGKHKGTPVHKVPIGYLKWICSQAWFAEKFKDLHREAKAMVDKVAPDDGPPPPEEPPPVLADEDTVPF